MRFAAMLTDTPTFGLTPGQRRWLGVGAAAAMLISYQAVFLYWGQILAGADRRDVLFERWFAALAAFCAGAIALTCAVAWERGRGGVLAPLGAALALVGLACGCSAMTAETAPGNVISLWERLEIREAPILVGQAWTAVALGAPAAFASLIALLGGGRRFPRSAVMALAAIVLLAALLAAVILEAAGERRALLGAIWGGGDDPALEEAFWIWGALALAAAPASVVSDVRMKRSLRAALYGLNALFAALLLNPILGWGDDPALARAFLALGARALDAAGAILGEDPGAILFILIPLMAWLFGTLVILGLAGSVAIWAPPPARDAEGERP